MNFGFIAASSTDIIAQAISVVKDIWLILVPVIGLPLGFWIIKKIIELWRGEEELELSSFYDWYEFIKREDLSISDEEAEEWATKRVLYQLENEE